MGIDGSGGPNVPLRRMGGPHGNGNGDPNGSSHGHDSSSHGNGESNGNGNSPVNGNPQGKEVPKEGDEDQVVMEDIMGVGTPQKEKEDLQREWEYRGRIWGIRP